MGSVCGMQQIGEETVSMVAGQNAADWIRVEVQAREQKEQWIRQEKRFRVSLKEGTGLIWHVCQKGCPPLA